MQHVGSMEEVRYSDETWVYSVETNFWSNVTDKDPKPLAKRSHAMVTISNNIIILFGGNDNYESSNDTWLFKTDALKRRRPRTLKPKPLSSTCSFYVHMHTRLWLYIRAVRRRDSASNPSWLFPDNVLHCSTVWKLVCVDDNEV